MDTAQLTAALGSIVGSENVHEAEQFAGHVATRAPWLACAAALVSPADTNGVAAIVQHAEAVGVAIIPVGGCTQIHVGPAPARERPLILLTTRRLARVLDYQPDDMTVTCEPGIELAALQRVLAQQNQFLAVDPPLPERATIGGIVSTNSAGFWRAQYGTPRDLVIGVHAVMAGGEAVKGGGKVVKNVAGYDVCKLFTGAWGTLGILTELTFRLRPLPESERTLAWAMPDMATAARAGRDLYASRLAIAFAAATNRSGGRARLVVGLRGTVARVAWQALQCRDAISRHGISIAAEEIGSDALARLRSDELALDARVALAGRLACLPSDLPLVCGHLAKISGLGITAHAGTGTVTFSAVDGSLGAVTRIEAGLPRESYLLWTCASPEIAAGIQPWGPNRTDFRLQAALKSTLDPSGTFSPGRFVGGL